MKILFFAANPQGTVHLQLDREFNIIEDGLQRSKLRDQFQLVSKWQVNSGSLRRALLEETPDIVHFSGHGEGQTGLVLVGKDEKPKPATADALSNLFKEFPSIKCVLLNACYAEVQAKAIVQHIDYVIGMKQAVSDDAAIAFATGFYDGLGYGKSIDVAFALGRNAIQFELASFSSTTRSRNLVPVDLKNVELSIESLPDYLIPVLLKKEAGLTGSSTISTPSFSETNSLSEQLRPKDDTIKADILKIYRERVQEFLADLKLSQIERFQLAILANVLGLSEADANRVLQEELEKRQHNTQLIGRELDQEQSSVFNASPSSSATFTKPNTQQRKILVSSVAVVATFVILLAGVTGLSSLNFSSKKTTDPQPSLTKGGDYTNLETLLKRKDWIEADRETNIVMLKVVGRKEGELINYEELNSFPCTDLQSIDNLWTKYSNGRFGYSVQGKIFLTDSKKDFYKFAMLVGWSSSIKERWIPYPELIEGIKNNPKAYNGTLPTINYRYWQEGKQELYSQFLFSRIQDCK